MNNKKKLSNIQLFQRFCSPETFDKIYHVSLSHLITFAELDTLLTDDDKKEISSAITQITEYRETE